MGDGHEQTQEIHAIQRDRRTLQGLLAKADKRAILTLLLPLATPYCVFRPNLNAYSGST